MNEPRPSDWKVLYGDRRQFAAYFTDQARAEHYAATHHGVVRALFEEVNAPPAAAGDQAAGPRPTTVVAAGGAPTGSDP